MLAALLHGKVPRSVDGYEDMMTSVVFGVLEHLPPAVGLCRVLAHMDGHALPSWLDAIESIHTEYWPWWDEAEERGGAEPDVALTLSTGGARPRLLVIEAKRKSGKHGHGRRDQLARQVDNGYRIAERRGADMAGLVYITTHLSIPRDDLEASRRELGATAAPLWWLSWRDIAPVLRAAEPLLRPHPLASMSRDAAACLTRWGMERFAGWPEVRAAPTYTFEEGFAVGPVLAAPTWTFEAGAT